jgi:hypothetical protein
MLAEPGDPLVIPGGAVTRSQRPPRGGEVKITKNSIACILGILLMVVSAKGDDPSRSSLKAQ